MSAVDDLITRVIEREGGYVNNPNDRGGATKYGITIGTLADWRGGPVTAADVEALTEDEARKIYKSRYFVGLDGITDPNVLELLFDYATNSGTGRAIKALQRVIGAVPDGVMGPKSNALLAAVPDQSKLYWPLVAERLDNFMRIVARDPRQAVFLEGWANRMAPFWQRAA